MRIDDDEEENDKDDVSNIAEDRPDLMECGIRVGSQRFNDEEIFDNVIEAVDDAGEKASSRTDEPA